MGELSGMAFLYWSEKDKRYELKIDNTLKAYTSGAEDKDHKEGKEQLRKMAEDNGYTVLES